MKLQLSPTAAASFAATIGAQASASEAAVAILDAFKAGGHNPFTRKDVDAVLVAAGFTPLSHAEWYPIVGEGDDCRFPRPARGYYGFPDGPLVAPIRAAVRATPTIAAPTATVGTVSVPGRAWVPEVPEATGAGFYADDLGLRRMAVAQTGCFGSYSPRAGTSCATCPLAAFCALATNAGMADIAAGLDRETERVIAEAKAAAIAAATPAAPAPVAEPIVTPTVPTFLTEAPVAAPEGPAVYPAGAQEIEVPFEGICMRCSKEIPEGSLGVHIAGEGMLHPACARVR